MFFPVTIRASVIYFSLLCILFFVACNKNKTPEQSQNQGKNFNRLLKTITTDKSSGGQRTVEYKYDTDGQVSTITTETITTTGSSSTIEGFFRNSAGQLDSIGWVEKTNGIVSSTSQVYFIYNGSGQLTASRHVNGNSLFDSSLYIYAGSALTQRLDYRNTSGSSFSLFLQVDYAFDGSGNMTQAIFQQFGPFAHTDTVTFHYDNKINPVPGGPNLFYLYPVYYNDYKSANNLTQAYSVEIESYDYSGYTYSANNKPLYRREIPVGDTRFAETNYYYD